MNLIRLFYTIMILMSIICGIFLLLYSYKRRNMPGAKYFILVLIAAIIYDGEYIGELNAANFSHALFWFHSEHIIIPLLHYFWFMMSLDYVHLPKKQYRILKYIMLLHPISAYILYFTNEFHHLYISEFYFLSNGYFPVINTTKGVLYIAPVLWGSGLAILSMSLYVRAYFKAHRLHRTGYLIMIAASLFPWATVFLTVFQLNYLGIDYFPVVTIISGVFYVYGIFHCRIFKTIPIATEMVFRQAKEGIMLLDFMNRILEANAVIVHMYPELGDLTKDNSFSSFVYRHPEFSGILNDEDVADLYYLKENQDRYYIAKVNRIVTEDDLQIGKMITISDVTQLYERQKKLELIASDAVDKAEKNEMSFLQAQISPHFLNNTLSVIASMITRAPEDAKELITDLGEYLSRCYYFDSESPMTSLKQEIETVKTYVSIEKARFRERIHFHMVCDSIPDMKVPRLVLQPLVENAIRHGILKKAEGGTVWLNIEHSAKGVFFEVRDDGVGMSEDMITSLTAEHTERKGVGIMNIQSRLLKYYHRGLTIKKVGQGISVSFCIPDNRIEAIKLEGDIND